MTGACQRLVQSVAVAVDRRSTVLLLGTVLPWPRGNTVVSAISTEYTGTSYWIGAGILYALAKMFEFTDEAVFSANGLLSGHILKHFAAAACFAILRYFETRTPILDAQPARSA